MQSNTTIIDHPLITHKITLLRDKNCTTSQFRQITEEVTQLLTYELTRHLTLKDLMIETPMGPTVGRVIADDVLIVPILRAGLGMERGIQMLIPTAKIAHVGMYRDPITHEPKSYYEKYPPQVERFEALIVDPLLATGGSIIAAIDSLKRQGVQSIKVLSIIGVRDGLEAIGKAHPDVQIYLGALDPVLNDNKYIEPGLGDAGDRLFGTK